MEGVSKVSQELVSVSVDHDTCIGSGICEMLESEVFVLDDDACVSSVMSPGTLPLNRALEAVDRCPSAAISIV